MSRIEEAIEILKGLGLPPAQQNERSALTLLALAQIGPETEWASAQQPLLRTVDIMEFMREAYGKDYAANSRETIRRQTLHQFIEARIVDQNPDDPTRATNSGNNCYGLTGDALEVIRAFGTLGYESRRVAFTDSFGNLQEQYRKSRELHQVELTLPDGSSVQLSPGAHNELQAKIISDFGPRYAPGAIVLYVGDTAKKHVIYEKERLEELSIPITQHDKLPDVILYREDKAWLYLIEAVTSHGPVSPTRQRQIEAMVGDTRVGRIYVTAFLNRAEFRRYVADIAWETEVWIAEEPDHLIHFDGERFLGPYESGSVV